MCQLTLVHSGNTKINNVILTVLMQENSRVQNTDGCGIYGKGEHLFKSSLSAANIYNLGYCAYTSKLSDGPFIGHVRAISVGNLKTPSVDHSHPFESEHYVFAHNGTLKFKDEKRNAEYKDKNLIDSQIFLAELEKNYTGDVVVDLQTTMKSFAGKFAFMIHHKTKDEYFVVRGKTATLFVSHPEIGDKKLLVVNTEKLTGEAGLLRACSVLGCFGIKVIYKDMTILASETIFKLKDFELEVVGELKEEEVVIAHTTYVKSWWEKQEEEKETEKTYKALIEYLNVTGQSIFDLDKLCFLITGVGLSQVNEDSYALLLATVEKIMLKFQNSKKMYRAIWDKIRADNLTATIYKKNPDLQWPYMLNNVQALNDTYRSIKNTLKNEKGLVQ